MRRLEYLLEMRSYPFDRVPAGALQTAYRQYRQRWPDAVILPRIGRAGVTGADLTWNPLGPSPINTQSSGRTSTIAVHPSDPGILYIGAAQGGVWKSVNGGSSWTPLTDSECSLAMGSIAIDPVNADIVYAGTGELHFSGDSYYGCGVLRSTDGGASWTQLGADVFDTNTVLARIGKVIVDAPTAGSASSTIVYVASSLGVHKSTDSGLTWLRVLEGIATDLVQHPSRPDVLWAAIGSPAGSALNGVYHSTDAGATWAALHTGFATTNVGRIALAFAPSTNATLYAAVQDAFGGGGVDGALLGIWRTTDGLNWTRVSAIGAACGSQCWYDLVIATDPLDPEIVYFGGIDLYRSTNGGASFQSILNGIHVDQHAIVFDPRNPATLFVGNDGGIYRSTNRGNTWTSLNSNLNITQFYAGISLHPTDTTVVLGGTQDNGTLEFSGDPVWDLVLHGDGGFTAIDYTNPAIAYAETQWQQNSSFSGPRQRVGPGFFNVRKVAGIDLGDRALFIPPLVMDPVDPRTLYFGTFRIYRTTNGADLWAPISPDLTRTGGGRISAIAPSRSSPGTLYVGTSDGYVQVSRDGGASWVLRNAGFPNRAVTDIAVDALDPAIAIAVVSGFGTGHVFRTTDFAVTWQDISGNLPDVPVNAVLSEPGLGSDIHIGTDLGTFRSTSLGTTWEPFNDGMPNVAVFDLAYNADTGMGVAATHGRGMFSFRASRIARLVVTPEDIAFTALEDSIRLVASPQDSTGSPVPAAVTWTSLDPAVVTVSAAGVVVSRGNGATLVIAATGGFADTTAVTVNQVPVALAGLADSTQLIIGEAHTFDANPVDANGITIRDSPVLWTSSNAAIVSIDAAGLAMALAAGSAIVRARLLAFVDSTVVHVVVPSITTITANPLVSAEPVSSSLGTRIPLLTVRFAVAGPEAVELTRLGFLVEGNDTGARLELVVDEDADGRIDEGERLAGSAVMTLRPGEPLTIQLSAGGLIITPAADVTLIVALRMSGEAPNGATFQATFLPAETSTRNVRSGAVDRLQQPGSPVASEALRTTVLGDADLLTLSENPVRSAALIFNFMETPATAAVYTLSGRLVADLMRLADADGHGEWDLRNDDGTLIAPGVYLIVFQVRGQVFRERLLVLRRQDELIREPHGPHDP